MSLQERECKKAEAIARGAEYLDLSASPEFMDAYIENMNFGEEDA